MRNRPDISYLTFLGLSLTVVIAMQKGDSYEDSVRFKLSDAAGHHVCYLSANAVRDAFLAGSAAKSSFVFEYNSIAHSSVLASPFQALMDVRGECFSGISAVGSLFPGEKQSRENLPDFSCFLSPSRLVVKILESSNIGNKPRIAFNASPWQVSYPVRAGPYSFI